MNRLTVNDCRKVGFCVVPGVREACVLHGVDFRDFVRNGMPLQQAEELAEKDLNVRRALEAAKERIERVEQKQ